MTLEQWISLTPEERNCERRNWPQSADGGYWSALLEGACDRFVDEFGHHELINHVATSAWQAATYEPSILVTTALWPPQLIEELPDRYLTFRIVQNPILGNKEHYLKTWRLVLGELLGWSPEQVREWARTHHERGLDGKEPMFYHADPLDFVALLLVPNHLLDDLIGIPRVELTKELIGAIDRSGASPLWNAPYDWAAAKTRIKTIIADYEGRTPKHG